MAEISRQDLVLRAREARRHFEKGEGAEGRACVESLVGVLGSDDGLMKECLRPVLEEGGEAFLAQFEAVLEAAPELWKLRKRAAQLREGLAFKLDLEAELAALGPGLAAAPKDAEAASRLAAVLSQAEGQKDLDAEVGALRLMVLHGLAEQGQRQRLVRRLQARGEPADAAELLTTTLAAHPDDIEGWRLLAEMLAVVGDQDRQIAALEQVVRLDDRDTVTCVRLARTLSAVGRNGEALAHLARLTELEPEDESHWTRLLRGHASAGDAEGEIRVLHRMLDLGLEHLVDRPRLVRMLVARDRDAEAVVQLKAIVAAAPDDVGSWRRLARTQADLGDVQGEIEALRGILKLDEAGASARSRLARLLTLANRPIEALEQLNRLAELEPDDASHWRRLAVARAAAGDAAGEQEALARGGLLDECGVDFRGDPLRPY